MVTNTVISYPTPLYRNPPIHPEYYQPSRFQISNITLGLTTTITVNPEIYPYATINLNFVVGQEVRILVPKGYGCYQINNMTAIVLSLPTTNEIVVNINSTNFDPYIAASLLQTPQVVAIGDIYNGQINTSNKMTGTYILGSFINISPA